MSKRCELEFSAFRGAERDTYNVQLMFPDPAVSARIDSVNQARGVRNTGEMGRALFQGALITYGFRAYDRLIMPVLVIAGRYDGASQPAGLRELARRLPRRGSSSSRRAGTSSISTSPTDSRVRWPRSCGARNQPRSCGRVDRARS